MGEIIIIKENLKGIMLILVSAILACIGQLCWKLSVTYGLYILCVGFVCYGVGAIFMIIAYRFGELSVLQPMLSMNYVLSAILGCIILQEPLTVTKIIGIFVISMGVICIGESSKT